MSVRAKKHLGQHFLRDAEKAKYIVSFLNPDSKNILEIGPGRGILTRFLFQKDNLEVRIIEIDREAVRHLEKLFPEKKKNIIHADFLEAELKTLFADKFSIIGNFPYNISSQILFRVLENKDKIPEVIGMFQKEVAERIVSPPGKKDYGILSVLMQAFYDLEIVMKLDEEEFSPPPKVKSAVVRMIRNPEKKLRSDEKIFFHVVKTAFNQRRKMLNNALSSLLPQNYSGKIPYLNLRAEALSWQQFDELAVLIGESQPRITS
jgi:16S rRNA (adenine1518-N6/adenine1519-N6)-dimethyltransferase